mgnify:CR=1 FL=1
MTDGSAYLAMACLGLASSGHWKDQRESNPLGGGAPEYPHNQARGRFVEVDGIVPPRPDPRFSRTPGSTKSGPPEFGAQTEEMLAHWSFSVNEIDELLRDNALGRRE